ncbi:DUF1097 domain-containing protein [Vibrio sp. Isolate25]|uniref:DUF1097 domain-containing protein n=1 Tax=Vibrio TaxID=662 RepID=UPI001EFDE66D|nr:MULTISPECIES: DUF1097 domain-containing protein [Vibrio]MCG9595664.1 DUF1097 domain-containing protein [Vibrio sp. Isolate25]MCG9677161.1 DUF1097 domain-containing protein [Vibrio sp. Isolate24]USD34192.1 DUF1097 domain-containing protein [Vibrio sp. SCSIO 43186]USD47264.1 DUF1097 domain-containing protein [Vibrio sp. SCSIO 43145]USD71316.1 DUF1097 domain-containing protein [Vibrio sp. SCSIO 43139]
MSTLVAISLTTGILSGLWGWIAISLGLLSWAGFLGCTSYFASPTSGLKGLAESLVTNMTGVFWAMVIIHASQYASLEILGYVITAIVAFMMCIQAKQNWLGYIPGTFIGSCATFAADGNWQLVIPSLILGGVFGYLMKASGLWLHQKSSQTQSASELPTRS